MKAHFAYVQKLVLMLCAIAACSYGSGYAATYYVALNGNNTTGDGSAAKPWATVDYAVYQPEIHAGDTIQVGGGTYYGSWVTVPASLTGVNFVNAPGQTPVLKGSVVPASGAWAPSSLGPNIYQCQDARFAWHPQQVYVNGCALTQMGPSEYMAGNGQWTNYNAGTGGTAQWAAPAINGWAPGQFLWSATNGGTVYIQMPSNAPSPDPSDSRNLVEVCTSHWIFNCSQAMATSVNGITFSQCSTTSYEMTGGGVIIGPNSTIISSTVSQCDFAGILIQSDASQGCTTVSGCVVAGNGDTGITVNPAPGVSVGRVLVSYCRILGNNYRGYSESWHAGGIKIIPNCYGKVNNCDIGYNKGPGIWWDTDNSGQWSTTRNNYVHDCVNNVPNAGNSYNNGVGILVEISNSMDITNNVVSNCDLAGILVAASSSVGVWNNDVISTGADCPPISGSNPNPCTPWGAMIIAGMPRTDNGTVYQLADNNITNNIIYNTTGNAVDFLTQKNFGDPQGGIDPNIFGNGSDYNLFYNNLRGWTALQAVDDYFVGNGFYNLPPEWVAATGDDAHSLNTDPLFAPGSCGYSYALQPASPVPNAGVNASTLDYDSWVASFALVGTDAQPNGDYDGDGVSNLAEFAFNLDPTKTAAPVVQPGTGLAGLPSIRLTGTGSSQQLRIEFIRRKNSGLTYTVQFSSLLDGASWQPAQGAPVVTSIDANWDRVIVDDTVNLGGAPRRFGRVLVAKP